MATPEDNDPGKAQGSGQQQLSDVEKTERGGLWWARRALWPPAADVPDAVSVASDSGHNSSRSEYADPATTCSAIWEMRTGSAPALAARPDAATARDGKESDQQVSVRRKFCTLSFGRRRGMDKGAAAAAATARADDGGKKRRRSWTLKFRNPFQLLTSSDANTEEAVCPAADSSCVCMSYTRKREQATTTATAAAAPPASILPAPPQERLGTPQEAGAARDEPRYQGAYEEWDFDDDERALQLMVDARRVAAASSTSASAAHYPRLLGGAAGSGDGAEVPSDIVVTSETRRTELTTINSEGRSVQRTVHTQVDYAHYLVPDLAKITSCGYYWGVMDRYEAERLLDSKPEGTFLLRDSAQDDFLFSVSFRRYGRSLHARVEQYKHRFSFDSHDPGVFASRTVVGLMEHYKEPSMCMFFEPLLTAPLNRPTPFSLQQHCRAVVASRTTYDGIGRLELPRTLKSYLKYYHYRDQVRIRRYES
ncbi:PREDICTED: uncharacterized protein LOC106811444 [Priapulus caudatus]|uniref:Uncharacterized protein LOC106811444 n=1 Tax=Priapulus caudatus TaxID=37621 RepID=A0ABM1EEC7_PRICU|nr:PREDICTED: uncharacterized protein LOC106811444 [Priapulus caudatus]